MKDPEDGLAVSLTETEYALYQLSKHEYKMMAFSSRFALKKLHQMVTFPVSEFVLNLSQDGFADPQAIMDTLKRNGFIDVHDGTARPAAARARFMDVILTKWPPC